MVPLIFDADSLDRHLCLQHLLTARLGKYSAAGGWLVLESNFILLNRGKFFFPRPLKRKAQKRAMVLQFIVLK